jgi:type IV pilus assembly protein PilA
VQGAVTLLRVSPVPVLPIMLRRRGFTLIELLIVVVIIGILAAIAIPKFQQTRTKALLSTLRSDLRNLATAQEAYLSQYGQYGDDIAVLNSPPSSGVTISLTAVPGGWSASASHVAAAGASCALFYGLATPVPPAAQEGQIACQ